MTKSTSPGASFDEGPDGRREPPMGEADAIQKTTYVVGQGTDPDADQSVSARVSPGSGPSVLTWAVIVVAIAIALFLIF